MADKLVFDKDEEKGDDDSREIAEKTRMNAYYKEINDYRRHYSNLRFALFPIYLTTQYGLIRVNIQPADANFCIPFEILLGLSGILITYVFWTIERRVISYYNYLKNIGCELELKLGYRLVSDWPVEANQNIIRNTELSITVTFIIAAIFWLGTICTYIIQHNLS
jgi:hypothetical protein